VNAMYVGFKVILNYFNFKISVKNVRWSIFK